MTKVGDDASGPTCRRAPRLRRRDRCVGTEATLRTPVTFCEIHPPDDFPLLFYREPSAPDLQVPPTSCPGGDRATGRVWTTGTGLSREPSRSAVLAALDAPRQRERSPSTTSTTGRCCGPESARRALGAGGARRSDRRDRQPRRGRRGRRRRARHAAGRRCSSSARGRDREAGPGGVLGATAPASSSRSRRRRSRSCTGSAPATPSAARCATGCSPAGRWSASCASPTRPAPRRVAAAVRRRHAHIGRHRAAGGAGHEADRRAGDDRVPRRSKRSSATA